ncbi:Uncharacterised protein [Helicobacter mustelae]|uniref:hypothetical protein n=1 Tax=Helicobacter mustelae TaxID=217 RepID=UPI000E029125|nr:hypothetical protein [Helicobacter mustelae]STP12400.1 Uncharacterised protein [Helicobacter mustelae]
MLNPLKQILEHPNEKKFFVDAKAYAHKVLMQDKPYPWYDPMLYSNYIKQVASLLKADVLVLRFDNLFEEELNTNKELIEKMSEKTRRGYALKIFLSDERVRDVASALINTVTNIMHVHVLTQLPSPLQLLKLTAKAAGQDDGHFEDNEIENSSVYYADWLRSYKDSKVKGLLFDERSTSLNIEHYMPVKNTADGYDWVIGFRRDAELAFDGFEYGIPVIPSDFWVQEANPGLESYKNKIVFSEIHRDAVPEKVLEKLTLF